MASALSPERTLSSWKGTGKELTAHARDLAITDLCRSTLLLFRELRGDGMFTIPDFQKKKQKGQPLVLLTCYDAWSASLLEASSLDAVLVGDSVAMVVHGLPDTLAADMDMMCLHTASVRRGSDKLCIIADMPFMASRASVKEGMHNAARLMRCGAQAVKIEGWRGHQKLIPRLVDAGIPVMGHLGLLPQSVHLSGGYKVQGRDQSAADTLVKEAQELEKAGCFSVVLECVPSSLAKAVSKVVKIPVIGIGAGNQTDGQILVFHDLLGLGTRPLPRFVRQVLNANTQMLDAVESYCSLVRQGDFPNIAESYGESYDQSNSESTSAEAQHG